MNLKNTIQDHQYMFTFQFNRLSDFLDKLTELHMKEEEYFGDIGGRDYLELLPNYYFNSFIIKVYSLMESEMFDICNCLLKYNNIDLNCEKDLTGSSVEKIKKCLTKIIHIQFNNDLWSEMDSLRIVRNVIVHKESILSDSEKNKLKIYMEIHNLSSDMVDSILINQGYCQYILDFSYNFINDLYYLTIEQDRGEVEDFVV